MSSKQNLGELLASDDEVQALKSRAKRKVVETPVVAPPVQEVLPLPEVAGQKRVTIILEENDNIPPTGQYFGCNGQSWILRPGEPVEVPEALVNLLDYAVQDVPQIDPATRQILGYRKRLRFPYRVVNLAAA